MWFKKSAEERSGGRLQIETYFVGALGFRSLEALSVLRDGLVDINEMVGASSGPEEPLCNVPNMPLLLPGGKEEDIWVKNVFNPVFEKELEEEWNCKLLMYTPDWVPIYFFSKFPLMEPEDFAGKRIRTWGGINNDALQLVGMTPFTISTAEIYTSLQRGMIDTAITSYVSASECKFWEVLDYVIRLPLYCQTEWRAINLDSLHALPEDLQEIVITAGRDATNFWAYETKFWPAVLLKMLTDGGMEVIDPPRSTLEAFKKMVNPVYQNFVDEANDPKVTALMRDLGGID